MDLFFKVDYWATLKSLVWQSRNMNSYSRKVGQNEGSMCLDFGFGILS